MLGCGFQEAILGRTPSDPRQREGLPTQELTRRTVRIAELNTIIGEIRLYGYPLPKKFYQDQHLDFEP
jgi:hypothetical protein